MHKENQGRKPEQALLGPKRSANLEKAKQPQYAGLKIKIWANFQASIGHERLSDKTTD